MKVIIQDNDYCIREIITLCLNEEGINVLPLEFARDVLSNFETYYPDVAILDFKINGGEAIETCRQIKEKYPDVPVLAMSCNNKIKFNYSRFGFDDFIEKPFDIDDLLTIVLRNQPHYAH
jgi:DNA-binding response OmpR family regulator